MQQLARSHPEASGSRRSSHPLWQELTLFLPALRQCPLNSHCGVRKVSEVSNGEEDLNYSHRAARVEVGTTECRIVVQKESLTVCTT